MLIKITDGTNTSNWWIPKSHQRKGELKLFQINAWKLLCVCSQSQMCNYGVEESWVDDGSFENVPLEAKRVLGCVSRGRASRSLMLHVVSCDFIFVLHFKKKIRAWDSSQEKQSEWQKMGKSCHIYWMMRIWTKWIWKEKDLGRWICHWIHKIRDLTFYKTRIRTTSW